MINILERMALVNPDLVKPAKPAEETKANLSLVLTPVIESPEMAVKMVSNQQATNPGG